MNTTSRTPLSRPLLGVLLASVVAVMSAAPAFAESTPRIFPLTADAPMPPDLSGAPAALSDALADLLEGDVTDRSLEELGKKLRCDIEVSTCLDAIARSLATGQLVYGTVNAAPDGKLKVKLVRYDWAKTGSEMHRRTFVLTAQTPKRLGKQLARAAAPMFDRPVPQDGSDVVDRRSLGDRPGRNGGDVSGAPAPAPVKPGDSDEPTEDPSEDPSEDRSGDAPARGRITAGTWGLIGGGAGAAAIGVGFLLSARSLEGSLARAPRETVQDLRQLQEIERAGKLRMQIGSTLAVAGVAVLAAGAVRAVIQRGGGGDKRESLERSVAVVPLEGGAAVVFSRGLR